MRRIISAYNLFYIFLYIIWQPFQLYVLGFDGANRTILLTSIIALVLNLFDLWRQKKQFFTLYFLCWFSLVLYSMLNSFSKGFYAEYGVFSYLRSNFLDPFVFLIITMVELHNNERTCLRIIWLALGAYLLIGIPSFGESVESDNRFSVEGLGNLYPLNAVCFLFVSCLLFVKDRMKLLLFVLIFGAVTAIIVMSGTRKALGAEAIILFGVILNKRKKRTFWSWVRVALGSVLFIVGIVYIVNHTAIGERITEDLDEYFIVQLVENNRINDFLLMFLGDRAIMYESGIEIFHENFWTGIGLNNYMDFSNTDYRLHTEYIVQLCENGIIGFTLLMLYYVFLIIAIVKGGIIDKTEGSGMFLFGLLSVLFLNFTTWTYNQTFIMVFYALIMNYASYTNTTKKHENSRSSSREKFQQSLDNIFGSAPDTV